MDNNLRRKELLNLAKILFECGLPYTHISQYTGLALSVLHREANKNGWQKAKHAEYIQSALVQKEKEKMMSREEKYVADTIVDCAESKKELVLSIAIDAASIAKEILKSGKKKTLVKLNREGEDVVECVEEDLSLKDLRDAVELADKASITLGINPRFSSAVSVNAERAKVIAPFKNVGLK